MMPALFTGSFLIARVLAIGMLLQSSFALYAQDKTAAVQDGVMRAPGAGDGVISGGMAGDIGLIRDRHFGAQDKFSHYYGAGNNEQPLQSRRHGLIAVYNPVSLVFKGALLGYQKILSQQLARKCPYEITCSNFSKQAIGEFGIFKGVFLSADRILRCNRIGLLDVSPLSINPFTGAIIDSPNMYR